MTNSPSQNHLDAENDFRKLLADGDLPAPDDVEYRERSLVFKWHDTMTAVVVDLDETGGA